jgi:hypothetical protein
VFPQSNGPSLESVLVGTPHPCSLQCFTSLQAHISFNGGTSRRKLHWAPAQKPTPWTKLRVNVAPGEWVPGFWCRTARACTVQTTLLGSAPMSWTVSCWHSVWLEATGRELA